MKLRLPHTFVLVFALVALAAALTWIVPAGSYERRQEGKRQLVDEASYHAVPAHPASVADVLLAWPRGLEAAARIVFYLLLIGGAFGVIAATGALDAGMAAVVRAAGGRGELVVPVLVLVFALGGGTMGIAEEALAVLPALAVLVRRLGYDELLAALVALAAPAAGYAAGFSNPFNVGVGQGIVGLPLFSGVRLRLVLWVALTLVTAAWIARAARRLKCDTSIVAANVDGNAGDPVAATAATSAGAAHVTTRHAIVLVALLVAVVLLVMGGLRWDWDIVDLAGLFLATAIVAGIAGGLGADGTAEQFVAGAAAFTGAALVVGLARGVLVIFDGAHVTDTILHAMVAGVRHLPAALAAMGVYGVQSVLSYVVPSSSGQAALTLPILAPLGDIVGITRQTSVLAYQLGDGFGNVLTPTSGYFMAGLAMVRVPWTRWVRVVWPLLLLWYGTGLLFVVVAQAIHWGPF